MHCGRAKTGDLLKPLVAGLTTAMIIGSYWWMRRKERACCGAGCQGDCAKEGARGCTATESVNGPR